MGVLSRRLGISSAKLRDECKKMSITVPPADYWRSLKAGGAPAVLDLLPHEGVDSFEFDRPRKKYLAEWLPESQQLEQRTPIAAPLPKAAPAGPRYLPLKVWADQVFGEHQPHRNTLLRLVQEGRIQPQRRRSGGTTTTCDRRRTIVRVKLAEAPTRMARTQKNPRRAG